MTWIWFDCDPNAEKNTNHSDSANEASSDVVIASFFFPGIQILSNSLFPIPISTDINWYRQMQSWSQLIISAGCTAWCRQLDTIQLAAIHHLNHISYFYNLFSW